MVNEETYHLTSAWLLSVTVRSLFFPAPQLQQTYNHPTEQNPRLFYPCSCLELPRELSCGGGLLGGGVWLSTQDWIVGNIKAVEVRGQ